MDKCIHCGAETLLYIGDDPVCMDCVDDLKAGREPGESRKRPMGSTTRGIWR